MAEGKEDIFRALPSELREIIHEYQGGIRIRDKAITITALKRIDGEPVEEKKLGTFSLSPGVWFITYSDYSYSFDEHRLTSWEEIDEYTAESQPITGSSTQMFILYHGMIDEKEVTAACHDVKRMQPSTSLCYNHNQIMAEDSKGEHLFTAFPGVEGFITSIRSFGSQIVIISMMRNTSIELIVARLVKNYHENTIVLPKINNLRVYLPQSFLSDKKDCLRIVLSKSGWEKALPQLKKFGTISGLAINASDEHKKAPSIILYRKNNKSLYLEGKELDGGVAASAIKEVIALMHEKRVGAQPYYVNLYCAIMRWCDETHSLPDGIYKEGESIYISEKGRSHRIEIRS